MQIGIRNEELIRLVDDSLEVDHPRSSKLLLCSEANGYESGLLNNCSIEDNENADSDSADEKVPIEWNKDVRNQNFPRDVCERLNLCAECFSRTLDSEESVVYRSQMLAEVLTPLLSDSDQWNMEIWELLWFAADVVGFPVLLAVNMIKYVLNNPENIAQKSTSFAILRNAPHRPKPSPSHDFNNDRDSILSMHDLHMALEKVLHGCIASDPDSRRGHADSYNLYRLVLNLCDANIIGPEFIDRLPTEFYFYLLSYFEQNENIIDKEVFNIEAIRSIVEEISEYKKSVALFFTTDIMYLNDHANNKLCTLSLQILRKCADFIKSHPRLTLRHEFVRRISMAACSLGPSERDNITFATEALAQFGVLTEDDIQIGLERLLNRVQDILLDSPSFDFSLSRYIFRLICENVISLYAVESWVRLEIGGPLGLGVLRKCFLWLERRPLSKQLKQSSVNLHEDSLGWIRQVPRSDEVKLVHERIRQILMIMSHEASKSTSSATVEQMSEKAVEDIERNCNMHPHSSIHIALMLISCFGLPEPLLASCCMHIIQRARMVRYTSDVILHLAMEDYVSNGSLVINSVTSTQTRIEIVETLDNQLKHFDLESPPI